MLSTTIKIPINVSVELQEIFLLLSGLIFLNLKLTIMSFSNEQRNFGVLKIDGRNVKIYSTQTSYSTINVGYDISDVRWSGDSILVTLKDGKVRRYTSQTSYSTI